jgi:4a-hydroxytetrahydrobiopterin dehydratase
MLGLNSQCQGEIPALTQNAKSEFKFNNFAQALEFTNKVGAIAEEEDHHPLIIMEYGRTTVDWWTHNIAGLHKNG